MAGDDTKVLMLYGVPGAERMFLSPIDCYESEIDVWCGDDNPENLKKKWIIEEWTAVPIGNMLTPGDYVAEWVAENSSDDLTEDGADELANIAKHPDVIAAFDAAIQVMASKTSYLMAETKVRDLTLTFEGDGPEQMLDGVPMYKKKASDQPPS